MIHLKRSSVFFSKIIILFLTIFLVFSACKNGTTDDEPVDYFGGVPIYLDGVSAGDAATVIGFIKAIYDNWGGDSRAINWADGRVTRINIIPGASEPQKSGTV